MYDNFFKTFIIFALAGITTFHFTGAEAQNFKRDSLENLYKTAGGEDKYEVAFELFVVNIENEDRQVPYKYAKAAYDIAHQLSDSLKIVTSGRAVGYSLTRIGDLNQAIRYYELVLNIAKRNQHTEQVKFLLNNLAVAYMHEANYDRALDYHFQSLLIREREGNKEELSIAYNNIGAVYFKLKDFEKALEYFKRSHETKLEAKDFYDLDRCLINIGLCYNELNNFDEAINYLKKAFELCKDECSDDIMIEGHFALGRIYEALGQDDDSKQEYSIAYDKAVKVKNREFWAESLIGLSHLSYKKGDYETCLKHLKEAELALENSPFQDIRIIVYNEFFKIYKAMADFENASLYQGKYIELKDSVYNGELIKNLAKVQTNYEERENIATIAAKEEALERQRRLNLAIVIIAVLAALLIFVLFRSNQIKKRVNTALTDAKSIIENQNKQLTSLNRNLEKMVDARTVELQVANEALKRVNDELDNFIYKTSHDIRGPLASLKGMCNVAIMDVKDQLALSYFMKLDATAERLNTILTRLLIINQINNSSASHELIDFKSIVEDVIILERKKGLPPKLGIRKEIASGITFYSDKELIRIILENLIDNAIKFYNDSDRIDPFVEINIGHDNGDLRIRVIDNGIGVSQVNPDKIFQMFSRASERSGTGGIGLYLTKTATEKLGGHIDLKTTPEGYTEFFVKFTISTGKLQAENA